MAVTVACLTLCATPSDSFFCSLCVGRFRETHTAVAYPPQPVPPTQPKDLAEAAVAKAAKNGGSSSGPQIDPMSMLKPNPRPTQQFKPKNMGWPHGVPTTHPTTEHKKHDGAVGSSHDEKLEQLPYPVDPYGQHNQPIANDNKSKLPVRRHTPAVAISATQSWLKRKRGPVADACMDCLLPLFCCVPAQVNAYMLVQSSTQSVMDVKGEVEVMLNWIPKSTNAVPPTIYDVTLMAPQLGGSFGGKTVQSSFCALSAAFCAAMTNRPVRFSMARECDMSVIGRRHPFEGTFRAAAEVATGKIVAMQIDMDQEAGATYDCTFVVGDRAIIDADSAYDIPQFVATVQPWFTNKASNTAFRSFGMIQAHHFTDYAVERLLDALQAVVPGKWNSYTMRQANLFPYVEPGNPQGIPVPVTPFQQTLPYAGMDSIWAELDKVRIEAEHATQRNTLCAALAESVVRMFCRAHRSDWRCCLCVHARLCFSLVACCSSRSPFPRRCAWPRPLCPCSIRSVRKCKRSSRATTWSPSSPNRSVARRTSICARLSRPRETVTTTSRLMWTRSMPTTHSSRWGWPSCRSSTEWDMVRSETGTRAQRNTHGAQRLCRALGSLDSPGSFAHSLSLAALCSPCLSGLMSMDLGEAILSCDAQGNFLVYASGVEGGQGLDTKCRQVAAYGLGVSSTRVTFQHGCNTSWFAPTWMGPDGKGVPGSNPPAPWAMPSSGATTGSDLNGGAILNACTQWNQWLKSLLNGTPIWTAYLNNNSRWYSPAQFENDVQTKAAVDLWPQAVQQLGSNLPRVAPIAFYASPNRTEISTGPYPSAHVGSPYYYHNWAAAAVLVMIDVSTGELSTVSADILYDAGISLNPAIDIGQIEGGFMQGLGYNTCEEVTYDPQGNLTSNNTSVTHTHTSDDHVHAAVHPVLSSSHSACFCRFSHSTSWLYKPPSTLEIPQNLNVHLWPTQDQVQSWIAEESAAEKHKPDSKAVHAHPKSSAAENHVRKSWVRMNELDIKLDTYGCQSSKATGEPPTVLGNTVYWAIRNAVKAALADPITAAMRADLPEAAKVASSPSASASASASAGVSIPADVRVLCPATTFNIRQAISSGGDPVAQFAAVHARKVAAAEARAKKEAGGSASPSSASLAAVAPVDASVAASASASKPSTAAAQVPSGAGAEVAASAVAAPVVAAK